MKPIYITTLFLFCFFWASAQQKPAKSIKDMIKTDSKSLSYKGEISKKKKDPKTFRMILTDEKSLAYKGEIAKNNTTKEGVGINKLDIRIVMKTRKQ